MARVFLFVFFSLVATEVRAQSVRLVCTRVAMASTLPPANLALAPANAISLKQFIVSVDEKSKRANVENWMNGPFKLLIGDDKSAPDVDMKAAYFTISDRDNVSLTIDRRTGAFIQTDPNTKTSEVGVCGKLGNKF